MCVMCSYSTQRLWLTLLETTRKLARDHGILGELYGGQISNRLTELTDDVQRIYKKVSPAQKNNYHAMRTVNM